MFNDTGFQDPHDSVKVTQPDRVSLTLLIAAMFEILKFFSTRLMKTNICLQIKFYFFNKNRVICLFRSYKKKFKRAQIYSLSLFPVANQSNIKHFFVFLRLLPRLGGWSRPTL